MRRHRTIVRLIAGGLCCVAFLSIGRAQSRRRDTVHVPSVRDGRPGVDTFMRLFPDLPPFLPATDTVRDQAVRLGQIGGLLDARDDLSDPIQSILNPTVFSPHNPDNPAATAGVTFLGQFIDHDLTLDLRSPFSQTSDPAATRNFRTAAFDLDSVYGDGPEESPELYDTRDGDIKFRVERIAGAESQSRLRAIRFDVPRDGDSVAVIGDSRNDEHIILSQLHVAMLRTHNAVIDRLRATDEFSRRPPARLFEASQRLVRWHYQWVVVNEFLPTIIGRERVADLLRRRENRYEQRLRSERGGRDRRAPRIPIEFSVAAYRFGHSQIRPSYRLNFGPDGGQPFFAFVFDDTLNPADNDPNDLRGGRRAPRRFVDWQTFFDFGDGNVRPNKRIDTKLSSVLMQLPGARLPEPGLPSDGVQSLASRNLVRHVNFGLPSGQAVAQALGLPSLTPEQLAPFRPFGMDRSTPLWVYILKEAEVLEQGRRLGPVGSEIVGQVFVGLLRNDASSYLAVDPGWRPTLPSSTPGTFRMTDLLRLAGVVSALN